jgi:hypothetical protein
MRPIYWSVNITMLHRIIINIIHVPPPISLIPEEVFPETPLPDFLFAPLVSRVAKPCGKIAFD